MDYNYVEFHESPRKMQMSVSHEFVFTFDNDVDDTIVLSVDLGHCATIKILPSIIGDDVSVHLNREELKMVHACISGILDNYDENFNPVK